MYVCMRVCNAIQSILVLFCEANIIIVLFLSEHSSIHTCLHACVCGGERRGLCVHQFTKKQETAIIESALSSCMHVLQWLMELLL